MGSWCQASTVSMMNDISWTIRMVIHKMYNLKDCLFTYPLTSLLLNLDFLFNVIFLLGSNLFITFLSSKLNHHWCSKGIFHSSIIIHFEIGLEDLLQVFKLYNMLSTNRVTCLFNNLFTERCSFTMIFKSNFPRLLHIYTS
jgi:hypothetical protein